MRVTQSRTRAPLGRRPSTTVSDARTLSFMRSPALPRCAAGTVLFAALLSTGCGESFEAASSATGSGASSAEAAGTAASTTGGGAGSASSATGTGGAPATTSTSAGGGGAPPGVEVCTNGLDDDADGHTDCADDECQDGFTCADEVPPGWEGPYVVFSGDEGAETPSCGDGWPESLLLHANISASPGACTCSCGGPVGSTCGTPSLTVYTAASNCTGASTTVSLPSGQCTSLGAGASVLVLSAKATVPVPSGGGCAIAQDGLPAPFVWKSKGLLCGGALGGAGCDSGTCVPKGGPDFQSGYCVAAAGDVACPSGPFQDRTVYYADAMDTRNCAPCDCSAPSGQTCTGATSLYTDDTCTIVGASIPNADQCKSLSSLGAMSAEYLEAANQPAGGACAPSGGGPTGAITLTGAMTVCCGG